MAGKKNDTPKTSASDISTIRNILMGQQMAEYSSEFEAIRQRMTEGKAGLSSQIESQGKDMDERFAKLEKEISDRFDKLEKLVADNVARLDQKFLDMSKADKQDLGQMLAEISKKLTS